MIITNLCTSPSSTIALKAGQWVSITTIPKKPGTKYWVSAYVDVTGGTISMRAYDAISASQRVGYAITANDYQCDVNELFRQVRQSDRHSDEYAHLHVGRVSGEQDPARRHRIFRRGYDAARLTPLGVVA